MKEPIFTGSGTAIITPFTEEGIDFPALERLLSYQLAGGTDAIIVCGTTGEASTLSYEERSAVNRFCVERVGGRVPVLVGAGSNNTRNAIALAQDAQEAGADGLLVVTPYYNKATQAGLIEHFTAIADSCDLPLVLYNVPSRTGVCCAAETYAALAQHPRILGVKEASGDFHLIQKTRTLCPEDFYLWSGNDEDTAGICMLGGQGVISVAANLLPRTVHRLTRLCARNDFAAAGELQLRLKPLIDVLFCEVNPIPIKTALAMHGLCEERFRLPLCTMQSAHRAELAKVLEAFAADDM